MRPHWYIPDGTPVPEHVPRTAPIQRLVAGQGPDVVRNDDGEVVSGGGGRFVGEQYKAEADWRQTSGGWWVCNRACDPSDFRRLATVPGNTIDGVELPNGDIHRWEVPSLMCKSDTGWRTTLEPTLGPDGWDIPVAYRTISERLRDTVDWAAKATADDEDRLIALCVDLLALNYHIARPELEAFRWFTASMIPKIIVAAATPVKRGP